MRRGQLAVIAFCALALVAGCGSSGTRTVSVSDSQVTPSSATGSSSTATSAATSQTAGGGSSSSAAGTGGTPATNQGGPAFAAPTGGAGGVSTAESVLQARGYHALDPADYRPTQTLRVLIGARAGSSDAHTQQAFFFVGGRFIGTDTSDPSAQLRVVGQSDTSVTLAYALYRPGDALCCSSGGQATVTYQLDNGRLMPLNPIPSASPGAARSRE